MKSRRVQANAKTAFWRAVALSKSEKLADTGSSIHSGNMHNQHEAGTGGTPALKKGSNFLAKERSVLNRFTLRDAKVSQNDVWDNYGDIDTPESGSTAWVRTPSESPSSSSREESTSNEGVGQDVQREAPVTPVLLGRADLDTSSKKACHKAGRNKISRWRQEQLAEDSTDRESAGRALLSMLKDAAPAQSCHVSHSEPQPLSVDEYQLWQMQAREDRELGADELNAETFGEDAGLSGWSFEENLAANEQLIASRASASAEDVRRLGAAMREVVKWINIPSPMKEAIRAVVNDGWENITWNRGFTAVHLAADLGRNDLLPLLIALKADPTSRDAKGRLASDIARKKQHWGCVWMLSKLEACDTIDEMLAVVDSQGILNQISSSQEVMRLALVVCEFTKFLDAPVDLAKRVQAAVLGQCGKDDWGNTALHVAAKYDRYDLMSFLVLLGVDLNAVDIMAMTAADVSRAYQNYNSLSVLNRLQFCVSLDEVEHFMNFTDTADTHDKDSASAVATAPVLLATKPVEPKVYIPFQ